ncbi:hypothetical protein [Kumtagia ephedrae]|uniref:Uncharacterized protein n=1 Tax=Kumtagia ephedrae TaxID=2116701 RepID=A0A2P7SET5_9HYPH|nr:hypothetical protein [Mesorhizobium ephedrae]PSJ61026.1 hypothetical protein C7I84_09965 [Mesorhizobium ephedrae]
MTDISKAPIATRRPGLPRPGVPRLGIGASLWEIFALWNDALKLAYVDPYTSLRRQPQVVPDDDLDGRDPSW